MVTEVKELSDLYKNKGIPGVVLAFTLFPSLFWLTHVPWELQDCDAHLPDSLYTHVLDSI